MIPDSDKNIIIETAKKYDIKTIWLFGSAVEDYDKANDIDLAVEGTKAGTFFKFGAELDRKLPKEVDIVNLDSELLMSINPLFIDLIREYGVKIYE
jgi:predicted nucleotidyltransferase